MSIQLLKQYHYVVFGIFLFFAQGCTTTPSDISIKPRQDFVLKNICADYEFNCVMDGISQVISLGRKDARAKGMLGSDIVIINEQKVLLTKPVRISKGVIYVPYDFKQKVVIPLLEETSPFMNRFRKIVIDAGHGGKDPGGIGWSGIQEKEVVLDIAKRFSKILRKKGINIKMTRETDKFIVLEERARIASRENADLFISIHTNIAKSRNVRGFEVYYLKPLDWKTRRSIYDPKRYEDIFENFSMKRNDINLQKSLIDMLYVHKKRESPKISKHFAKHVSSLLNVRNRGSKAANFSVLRNTVMPAILIEVGFLSNRREAEKLKSRSYRQKIAESLAESLVRYAQRY